MYIHAYIHMYVCISTSVSKLIDSIFEVSAATTDFLSPRNPKVETRMTSSGSI